MTEARFDDVPDALETSPAEAALIKARSSQMIAVRQVGHGWILLSWQPPKTQGVPLPRMNDLLRGRIDTFSLDALMMLATGTGLIVQWRVGKLAA